MGWRTLTLAVILGGTAPAQVVTATASANAVGSLASRRVCPENPHSGMATCFARVLTRSGQRVVPRLTGSSSPALAGSPRGYGPADISSAYQVPATGLAPTVAVVDAFDNPRAELDLSVYRTQFGLPACTSANGCFRKIDQNGGGNFSPRTDWETEISLDLQAVSAVCPTCHLLLVEGADSRLGNLMTAVAQAITQGSAAVSLSFGGPEDRSELATDTALYHPGVVITASTGDGGYPGGVIYPAASANVIAVGGTTLIPDSSSRGWNETVWGPGTSGAPAGSGSGCSAWEPLPSWQTQEPLCSHRSLADTSAVGDPATGLATYDSYNGGWLIVGGTSLSSPLVAGMFALAGDPGDNQGATAVYQAASRKFDVTAGTTAVAGCPNSWACNGGPGYDGPTGVGSPDGLPSPVPYPSAGTSVSTSIDFGAVPETGPDIVPIRIDLANTGTGLGSLHVRGVTITGPDAADFVITQNVCAGASIPPGASCSAMVGFRPHALGSRHAQIAFEDDAASANPVYTLTGAGHAAAGTDESFVDRVYATVLGRPSDFGGLSSYVSLLAGGGTRAGVSAAFLGSQEYRQKVIAADYVTSLHRGVDPSGLASYTAYLGGGGTDEGLVANLCGSAEYFRDRAGGDDTGFVAALYLDILGRAPDPASIGYVNSSAAGVPRARIAAEILSSYEYRSRLITGLYTTYLGRSPDSGGMAFYQRAIGAGLSDEAVAASLVLSTEFAAL